MSEENLPCFIDFQTYNNRYKFIRKARDPLLGEVQHVKDTQYNKTILAKERILKTKEEINKEIGEYDLLYHMNECPGAVKFIGYTYKHNRNVTPNVYHFISLREHHEHDLEREMASRLRNKVLYFVVNCLSFLLTTSFWQYLTWMNRMCSLKTKSGRSDNTLFAIWRVYNP